MIKRPLNARFHDPVLEETKITTIRDKPWPVGVPIMLYHWSGLPYRSQQLDVCPVVVEETTPIRIGRTANGALIYFHAERGIHPGRLLWQSEGFFSQGELHDWFSKIIKPGQTVEKHLMRFKLHTP